jgi:hypothetical protein
MSANSSLHRLDTLTSALPERRENATAIGFNGRRGIDAWSGFVPISGTISQPLGLISNWRNRR